MPDDGERRFRVEGSIGIIFEADTLEACKQYVLAHPEQFPPKQRVTIRGPSVADPAVEDRFPFVPPTFSERFCKELLQAMGPDRGRVTSTAEENERVPGQTAAVWFTNNRATNPKRICIVRRGNEIGMIEDLDPQGLERRYTKFMLTPFESLAGLGRFVLDYLFGNNP